MRRKGVLVALAALTLQTACAQRDAGRATAVAGTLAVVGGASNLAETTCYEPTERSELPTRQPLCMNTGGTKSPGAAAGVIAAGVGAVIVGHAIEQDALAKEGARKPGPALAGPLPGQESESAALPARGASSPACQPALTRKPGEGAPRGSDTPFCAPPDEAPPKSEDDVCAAGPSNARARGECDDAENEGPAPKDESSPPP